MVLVMPFPESQFIEFKQLATKHIEKYNERHNFRVYPCICEHWKEAILLLAWDDKSRKVLGCAKENVDRDFEKENRRSNTKLSCVHLPISMPDRFHSQNLGCGSQGRAIWLVFVQSE